MAAIMSSEKEKKYKYSEIFGDTFQGEGHYCGVPTVWIRFWGCNFECNGFGQVNPADPSTYDLHYQTVDISSIKRMEDLPVFNTGCDSSYSWSKKFAHLAHTATPSEMCDQLEAFMKKGGYNPDGKFQHPKSGQWTHLAFTGGEPMMNQNAIVDIMKEFERRGNLPKYVTVETNGTQKARDKFSEFMIEHRTQNPNSEWFWSVSPKLYLSGEQKADALQPEVVQAYKNLSDVGQLKYVCDGSDRAWQEIEEFTQVYRDNGIEWPVWIMPVGATVEGQNKVAADVAVEACRRGYNVAARVHCYVFGNQVGR